MWLLLLALLQTAPSPPARTMAITIDDLPTASVFGEDLPRAQQTTRDLVGAIRRAGVPAIGFVNEGKLQPRGKVDPQRVALLQQWLDAGLELGNHTFSHIDLHRTDVETFQRDVLNGERVLRRLLSARNEKPRYFRHPYLHTGRSLDVRNALVSFLSEHGYVVAPVTLDNYEYVYAAAYDRANAAKDPELAKRIVSSYLDYMDAVVAYYEQQSQVIVGREIAHTLLLHANALNAASFEALMSRFRQRGYRFIPLGEALKDPAYGLKDEYVGPAGMTWLHRWGLTRGIRAFAGEPLVPDWVEKVAQTRVQ